MIKKFLFALTLLGVLASPSCREDFYQEDLRNENYTKAFIREFGLIDPNHTWGFTFDDKPASRNIITNGNEWKNDWWAPQNVTKAEHDLVMAYVSGTDGDHLVTVDIASDEFKNAFHNFFVTHVGSSMQEYSEVGGTQLFEGGDKMNYLHIAEYVEQKNAGLPTEGTDVSVAWPHVNNFNAAGCSSWEGHMLVIANTSGLSEEEAKAETQAHGAYDFCYHNAYDGGYYGRYKIVRGADVPNSNGTLDQYYYLCFDYMVKKLDNDPQTGFNVTFQEGHYDGETFVPNNPDQQPPTEEKMFNGVYLNSDKTNWPSMDDFYTAIGKSPENAKISSVTIKRYNNAKVVEPNNIYDDWVIRLVGNATRKTEAPPEYVQDAPKSRTKRVFVEDLAVTASHNLNVGSSDWDFNDVVFDVSVSKEEADYGKATIKLLALGGTLPVFIGTDEEHLTPELHFLMGYDHGVMVNTGAGPDHIAVTVDTGDMIFDPYDYRSVKVFALINGEYVEMDAPTGGAPAKVAGRTTDTWARERQHITTHWDAFRAWVENPKRVDNWVAGLKDENTSNNQQQDPQNGD